MEIQQVKIKRLHPNEGQIEGLPTNPRQIKKKAFDSLKKSIKDAPEMLHLRELIVYPYGDDFVVIGGNMRLRACRELGFEELPCKVLPAETPAEKLREYAIKDNVEAGEDDWDVLANEWNAEELTEWGLQIAELKETEKLSLMGYQGVYYEPKNVPQIKLKDCINDEKFNAKIQALQDLDLTEEQRQILMMFAYRFIKIDFESVANYYTYNATDEERKAIERLRLVLVDGGEDGFIEDEMLRILADEFRFVENAEEDEE